MPYRLETRIVLRAPLPQVFAFFADVRNLETITPPFLRFRVLTPDVRMREGALIDYRLRLRGVPFRWQSEITRWEPNERFKDEQRRGPYKYWRHLHLFRETAGGTIVDDAVDYDVPGGYYVHQWFAGPNLVRIFSYRFDRLAEIFGVQDGQRVSVAIQLKR